MPEEVSETPLRILGIPGSLRRASLNRALLRAAAHATPETVDLTLISLDDIPFYNEDVEKLGIPNSVVDLRQAVASADGILIATPEYNSGVPGVLKNSLDWLSRPPKPQPFEDKPVGVLGATPGSLGTRAAQYQLRQTLAPLNAHVMAQPMMFVSGAYSKFDENGQLTDSKTTDYLNRYLTAFAAWIRRLQTS